MELKFIAAFWILRLPTIFAYIPTPIVQIEQGLVQGEVLTSTITQRPFYSFRGIPFGSPPIENLRFKAPEAVQPWTDVYNATIDGPMCLQYVSFAVPPFLGTILGAEDCLYINIYTPNLPSVNTTTPLFPILVFFYGGGFGEGSDSFSMYGPHRFMDKDMILVEANYRLGAFGFLSTDDSASSGNYGLLDQLLVLKWIQSNAAAFNGDSSRVTISGQSAGSASVLYHVLSSASTGLFHQAILESGSSLAPWAMQLKPRSWANQLANALQCPTENSTQLVDCLRTKPAIEIVNIAGSFNNASWMALTFIPVIENPAWGKFLTESPMKILQSGNFNKVPTISGVVKDEGSFSYGFSPQYFEIIDDHLFDVILPTILETITHFQYNFVNLSYAIKEEYFTDIDILNQSQVARAAENMYSDLFAFSENDITIRLLTNQSVPVYMYVFEYPDCYQTNFSGQPEVAHTAELYYLYNTSFIILNDDCKIVSNILVDLWSNFVIQGNPNNGSAIWTTTPPGKIEYLEITKDLIMRDGFFTQRMWFWNEYLPTIGGSQYV